MVRINKRNLTSPVSRTRLDVSTGDQIIKLEYANDGTEDAVSDVRKMSIADGCDQMVVTRQQESGDDRTHASNRRGQGCGHDQSLFNDRY